MSTAGPAETRQRLLALLVPVVTTAGYDLEDVTVTPAGRRSLVRISVDADGGID
ncbi:MAG: ribosome maturation factor RimP, partial [Pseudonocardiales bacterium]|nr:ribosome maturation factor RimP [Pseudonocardiales bacterium]